jgi:hypothetical protein
MLSPLHQAQLKSVVDALRTIDAIVPPPGLGRPLVPDGHPSWSSFAAHLATETQAAVLFNKLSAVCGSLNLALEVAIGDYRAALQGIHDKHVHPLRTALDAIDDPQLVGALATCIADALDAREQATNGYINAGPAAQRRQQIAARCTRDRTGAVYQDASGTRITLQRKSGGHRWVTINGGSDISAEAGDRADLLEALAAAFPETEEEG